MRLSAAITKTGGQPLRRTSAALAAAILVIAQCLAVSHFHSYNSSVRVGATAPMIAEADFCALCNLASHAPLEPATAPRIEHPVLGVIAVALADSIAPISKSHRHFSSRAPPVAF